MKVRLTGFSLCAGLLLVVCTSGCMKIGPDFRRPATQVSEEWLEKQYPGLRPQLPVQNAWWEVFGDPILTKMVRAAFEQNLPLRVAGLRVIEGRAQLGIAVGNLYPQTQTGSGGYTFNQESHLSPSWPQPGTKTSTPRRHLAEHRGLKRRLGTRLLGEIPPRHRIGRRRHARQRRRL